MRGASAQLASSVLAAALAFSPLPPLPLPLPPAAASAAVPLDTTVSALQQQERTLEDLFERATPSVVYITTFVERTDRVSMNAVEVPRGTGSGFVWDDACHVSRRPLSNPTSPALGAAIAPPCLSPA